MTIPTYTAKEIIENLYKQACNSNPYFPQDSSFSSLYSRATNSTREWRNFIQSILNNTDFSSHQEEIGELYSEGKSVAEMEDFVKNNYQSFYKENQPEPEKNSARSSFMTGFGLY